MERPGGRRVMPLRGLLGARRGTLEPEGGADRELRRSHHPAIPGTEILLELESPVLGAAELARVLEGPTVIDATYARGESRRHALLRICAEASQTQGLAASSDRPPSAARDPIPIALAAVAVHD